MNGQLSIDETDTAHSSCRVVTEIMLPSEWGRTQDVSASEKRIPSLALDKIDVGVEDTNIEYCSAEQT